MDSVRQVHNGAVYVWPPKLGECERFQRIRITETSVFPKLGLWSVVSLFRCFVVPSLFSTMLLGFLWYGFTPKDMLR